MSPPDALKHSPLDAEHRSLGAKMVPFGGWEMPLAYPTGTLAEHLACRNGAVAFDVSHLGTVRVTNEAAFIDLQVAVTNDLTKIGPGRAQYTHLLDPSDASVVDDIIVLWVDDDRFDVMPNASNTSRVEDAVGGENVTATRAVIAVQGPYARERLAPLSAEASPALPGEPTFAGPPSFAGGAPSRPSTAPPLPGTDPRPVGAAASFAL